MIHHISGYRHHVFGHLIRFAVLVLMFFFFTKIIYYEPSIGEFLGIGGSHSALTQNKPLAGDAANNRQNPGSKFHRRQLGDPAKLFTVRYAAVILAP